MYGTTTTATAAPASSGRAAEQPKTALIYGQMNELHHPRSRGTTLLFEGKESLNQQLKSTTLIHQSESTASSLLNSIVRYE